MASKNFKTSVDILAGPSKWDLMLGLMHSTREHPHYLEFELPQDLPNVGQGNHNARVSVWISSIQREDGSGESWILTGVVIETHNMVVPVNLSNQQRRFEAYYTTKHRRGHINHNLLA